MKVSEIAKVVAAHFELNINLLLSGKRSKTYVTARKMCCVLSREYTMHSSPEISDALGLGDHSTVLHHIKTHPNLMRGNRQYAEAFMSIRSALGRAPEQLSSETHTHRLRLVR